MKFQEPVPVAPFLEWCDRRLEQIRTSLAGEGNEAVSRDGSAMAALAGELGWSADNTARRLYRYRYESVTGEAERAGVEPARARACAREAIAPLVNAKHRERLADA